MQETPTATKEKEQLTIDLALIMGPFVQITVGFRNPANKHKSFFLTALVEKSQQNKVTSLLDDISIYELGSLVDQIIDIESLLIGAGGSVSSSNAGLMRKLKALGAATDSESLQLRVLMLTSDLLTTVSSTGVDYGEYFNPDQVKLESVLKALEDAQVQTEKNRVYQDIGEAPNSSFAQRLEAAVNAPN